MTTSSRTLFDQELVTDLFNKVKGKSSLAVLSKQIGMPFVGTKEFTFSMDKDIDIVAENGKHSEGGISFEPIKMIPIKMEYGARVSDEFLNASEEEQIDLLKNFNDGFAKKLARGLDIAAMHGFNPRTGEASTVVGGNHFDAKVTNKVKYDAAKAEENLNAAIAMVDGVEAETTGIAMSKVFAADMAKVKENGVSIYPGFKLGGCPDNLNGIAISANTTVSKGPEGNEDHAIVGDFESAFKWGYGKDIEMEIIKYGDPDASGKDLKAYGQVYIRAEAYLGWGILAPEYFARIAVEA